MLYMFLQDEDNAYVYVLFYFRVNINETSAPTLDIYENVSRMDRTKDLRDRGEKTVLVKKADVAVDADDANITITRRLSTWSLVSKSTAISTQQTFPRDLVWTRLYLRHI